ncbi:MAG: MAPEG family protein [Gammaproteobacteria bacterium]|nr:MAPEG family protein [Gammaproteobacteria bacterium]MDH3407937.1 MAPEG family protein [Gammaproteobacteria bacterium]MDH3551487.1 MAPEG family protein [Gammaproteobacteria bacterium]
MDFVAVVTVLALFQFGWFGMQVGSLRAKHQVKAPATSGPAEFERMFRVHYNTMEQLILFLPALWVYAYVVNPLWAAGFGVVYLVGRFVYRAAYIKDPAGRSTGFMLSFLPSTVMLIWVLVAAVRNLL